MSIENKNTTCKSFNKLTEHRKSIQIMYKFFSIVWERVCGFIALCLKICYIFIVFLDSGCHKICII